MRREEGIIQQIKSIKTQHCLLKLELEERKEGPNRKGKRPLQVGDQVTTILDPSQGQGKTEKVKKINLRTDRVMVKVKSLPGVPELVVRKTSGLEGKNKSGWSCGYHFSSSICTKWLVRL